MKYIKIPKIQISGLPPQRRITRKLNESSFGPCSRFWHPNLTIVHQDAKIADMHHRSRNRAVSRMIISHVLICINFHTAMHSDRFLAAEIEIAKSARCQTTHTRAACSRYRRKLYHIYPKVSDIRSISRGGTSSLRSSVIKRPSACGTSSVKQYVKENCENLIRKQKSLYCFQHYVLPLLLLAVGVGFPAACFWR